MGDGQDHQDAADESGDLADVVASLEQSEDSVPADPMLADAPAEKTAPDAAVAEPEGADTVAAVVPDTDAAPDAPETEPIDPEIAALQAELESEGDDSTPDVEDSKVEPESTETAEEPETTDEEPAAVADEAPEAADAEPAAVAGEQAAAEDAQGIALPVDRAGIPLWPFLIYIALWIIFAGLFVWQSLQIPAGTPLYELNLYGLSILVGLILTALGPLLAIGVWLACWIARPNARTGLFSRSLIIGAVATLAGVTLWLVALGAVDMLRIGRLI